MKTLRIITAVLAAAVSPYMFAQDVYDAETLSSSDLNGTARYVGMGGAMNALGADISTMANNPAGIGLYRRSDVNTSFSVLTNPNGEKFDGKDKTSLSFDNIGFVYSCNTNGNVLKYINFGFAYSKKKNFNQNYYTEGALNGLSQNGQLANLDYYNLATPLVHAAGDYGLIYEQTNAKAPNGHDSYWYPSKSYAFQMAQWGGIEEYDFNVSFNLSDQVYLGMTIGAYNMNYHSYQEYAEALLKTNETYNVAADRHIDGGGIDAKFGIIIRPFEQSPFRIGLSVATPTYYDLHTNCTYGYDKWYDPGELNYNFTTPWKLGVSLGNTFGNYLALDAEYEYTGTGTTKLSYDSNNWDDSWGWDESSYEDHEMTNEYDKRLKGTHTFKIGGEAKVADGVFLRAGYNFVSSMFENNSFRDQYNVNSAVLDYTTTTNYMNRSHINRYTCGIGYRGAHLYGDFAYQYNYQTGRFYPFDDSYNKEFEGTESYVATALQPTKVKLNRSQFLFTLGYKF